MPVVVAAVAVVHLLAIGLATLPRGCADTGDAKAETPVQAAAPDDAQTRSTTAASRTAQDASPPDEPQTRVYVIAPGDTLSAVAQRHGVTQQELIDLNNLTNPDALRVGQELVVPDVGQRPADESSDDSGADNGSSASFLDERDPLLLEEPLYAWFVHNSETWDTERFTYESTQLLNETVRKHDIPVISLVEDFPDAAPAETHYLDDDQITYPVRSKAGNHHLYFSGKQGAILSGGYLEHCLRRAIRDMDRGAMGQGSDEPLRLYLVADAVYVSDQVVYPVLDRRRDRFEETIDGLPTYSLHKAMQHMSDEALSNYLREQLLYTGGRRVSDQHDIGAFDTEDIRLRIYRRSRKIASTGNGRSAVDLIVLDSEDLRAGLSRR